MGALLWSLYRLHMGRENLVKSSDPFQTRVEMDFRGNRLLVTGVLGGSICQGQLRKIRGGACSVYVGKIASSPVYKGSGGWWLNSGFPGGKLKSGSGTVFTQGSVHIVTVDSCEDQLSLAEIGNGGLVTMSVVCIVLCFS